MIILISNQKSTDDPLFNVQVCLVVKIHSFSNDLQLQHHVLASQP